MTTSGVEFDEDSFSRNPSQSGSSSAFGGVPNGASGLSSSGAYGSSPSAQFVNSGYAGPGTNVSGLTGWLMRHGIVKSPQGAQIIMIGIVIINIIITVVALTYYL